MVPCVPRGVNAAAALILAACAAPEPEVAAAPVVPPGVHAPRGDVRVDHVTGGVLAGPLSEWSLPDAPQPPTLPARSGVFDELLGTIDGASLDMTLGTRLEEALGELDPDDVAALGVAALTFDQLVGTEAADYEDALCEPPAATFTFEQDGQDYEARVGINAYFNFVGDPQTLYDELDPECAQALLANDGDLDAAVADGDCADWEVWEFFPEGSDCRKCVVTSGDYEVCVQAGECPRETVSWTKVTFDDGNVIWYQQYQVPMVACAPDYTTLATLLVTPPADGSAPEPWDHAAWAWILLPFWDESIDTWRWHLFDGAGGPAEGGTLIEGLWGHAEYVREAGSTGTPYAQRQYFVRRLEVEGVNLDWSWGWNPGSGAVSLDLAYTDTDGDGDVDATDDGFGYVGGFAFGLRPTDLRPDGEIEARDYVATVLMKSATTQDGALISVANHSRCAEWEGPDAEGAYHCAELGPPEAGWLNDAEVAWLDAEHTQVYAAPMATLASSGLPDPDVPGGFVIDMAGSPALADPDWEGCDWPHRFVPDVARFGDRPGEGGGDLTGNVFRFGKDGSDVRAVLSTNRARFFCPQGP